MAKSKKMGLIKKDPMKDAGKVALKFALRGGSAIAAGAASNMANSIIPKFHGPIAMGIGLAAEMFVDNEEIVAVGQGIGAWGSIQTAKEFVPETAKAKLGLGSTSSDEAIEIDSTPDWDALAEEIDFEEVDEEPLAGEDEEMSDEEYEELFDAYDDAEEELQGISESLL